MEICLWILILSRSIRRNIVSCKYVIFIKYQMSFIKPQIIQDVGFDFSWSEEKVWKLDVPITKMKIDELLWHLDIPFLWVDGGIYNVSPREVLASPERYKEEYERTVNAEIGFPIDIMENKGRWLILDGLHRLMQASMKEQEKVNVRIIPREYIPQILR